ncbi:MAG: SagB/ThcOx family dehydrogenase [Lentisphaerae bacterium]|nr:SagB/ThcOx family dehydrogenase [Lentisphaerota bacterium]MBT5604570.1 SagB/ThcOx family dehydrogenase [Lentisphaerota bacterium]MBT7061743.1 SagB/ThcOx family dehydrogenase [Lentisphaerota bacterium]MBT7848799.1 SagB/ThcOx family dehydrogenase [Lentisphaerota bacterium]
MATSPETLRQREFLKDTIRLKMDFRQVDQNRGVPPPPAQKPAGDNADTIPLTDFRRLRKRFRADLFSVLNSRRSVRTYLPDPLDIDELSLLLWATQGVTEALSPSVTLRTAPSAGARHALETYIYARNVDGLTEGVYRYLPLDHALVLEFEAPGSAPRVAAACLGQTFVGAASCVLFWATVPYRMEWRYGLAAHRVIPIDAGHVCQNLYLACEAIGAGTCAIGAYDQGAVDDFLRLDGQDEFVIYLAPVGKKPEQ